MSAQLRQQTISFSSAGRPQANRPGPRPKAPTALTPAASSVLINGARRVSRYFTHAEVEADIEAVRAQEEQEEKEASPWVYSNESDIDDEEHEFDPSNDDEDFDEGRQEDEDIADENM